MKFNVYYVIKKIWNFLNKPEVAVILVVVPVGLLMSIINYTELQSYYYTNNVFWISVYDEDSTNFKKQMLFEIEEELKRNNLGFAIKADTTANEVFMYQTNTFNRQINDWCIYIGRQAFKNLEEKNKNLHCIKVFFYVTDEW